MDLTKAELGRFATPKDPDANDIWINEDAP